VPPPLLTDTDGPPDLGTCLSPTSKWSSVPILATFDGHGNVVTLDFYSQCSGERFVVDQRTADCVRTKLEAWEWPHMSQHISFVGSAARDSRRVSPRIGPQKQSIAADERRTRHGIAPSLAAELSAIPTEA